jgi:uncharacterized protein YlxP (DUF503 family)
VSAFVALMLVHLHFPDAGSLKGKRKDLASIKAQLHGRLGVAVAEVDHQDLWQRSTLALAATAGTHHGAELVADQVERFLEDRLPQGVRVETTIASFQELL